MHFKNLFSTVGHNILRIPDITCIFLHNHSFFTFIFQERIAEYFAGRTSTHDKLDSETLDKVSVNTG